MKHTLQKYLSVFYLMLFIFQIALTDSITIKNFSINSIHALYGDEIDHDYLIDFESTGDGESGEGDNEEGESDEKNDEEQDLEDDFLRQVISMSSLSASECNHFEYVLKSYTKRVKEQFSPPDCRV
uniref:Uncharacterized protein n=2 Tax=uncultured Flavobacteriia bacterium TaxID=212695 RepID=H6RIE9_9BACT|nr:hypothetical protein VIS_S3CLB100010 [uncultured Flavobacteriia bacterium]